MEGRRLRETEKSRVRRNAEDRGEERRKGVEEEKEDEFEVSVDKSKR